MGIPARHCSRPSLLQQWPRSGVGWLALPTRTRLFAENVVGYCSLRAGSRLLPDLPRSVTASQLAIRGRRTPRRRERGGAVCREHGWLCTQLIQYIGRSCEALVGTSNEQCFESLAGEAPWAGLPPSWWRQDKLRGSGGSLQACALSAVVPMGMTTQLGRLYEMANFTAPRSSESHVRGKHCVVGTWDGLCGKYCGGIDFVDSISSSHGFSRCPAKASRLDSSEFPSLEDLYQGDPFEWSMGSVLRIAKLLHGKTLMIAGDSIAGQVGNAIKCGGAREMSSDRETVNLPCRFQHLLRITGVNQNDAPTSATAFDVGARDRPSHGARVHRWNASRPTV
eukprot:scaffold2788_cov376-Prasinococcus_capsulatus_cf.AAC.1